MNTGLDDLGIVQMYELIYYLCKTGKYDNKQLRILYKYQYYLSPTDKRTNPDWGTFIEQIWICMNFIIVLIYKEQDNIVGYVRQTGIDAVKYEAWIMELLQKQGGKITRENVVELLNAIPPQAYRLLKKMSDKGRIKLIGSGRSAYYELI